MDTKSAGKTMVRGVVEKILHVFDGGTGAVAAEAAPSMVAVSESVAKVDAIMSERQRLRGVIASEERRVVDLHQQLREKEAERIGALAAFKIDGGENKKELAAKLLAESEAIRREVDDAGAVAARLHVRVSELDQELVVAGRTYTRDMGSFLSAMCRRMFDRYNKQAPELAETVLQIAAIHRVMLHYQTGTSAGWRGAILLPGMIYGEGRTIPDMLDGGSEAFGAKASDRMGKILAEMREAGFRWKLD